MSDPALCDGGSTKPSIRLQESRLFKSLLELLNVTTTLPHKPPESMEDINLVCADLEKCNPSLLERDIPRDCTSRFDSSLDGLAIKGLTDDEVCQSSRVVYRRTFEFDLSQLSSNIAYLSSVQCPEPVENTRPNFNAGKHSCLALLQNLSDHAALYPETSVAWLHYIGMTDRTASRRWKQEDDARFDSSGCQRTLVFAMKYLRSLPGVTCSDHIVARNMTNALAAEGVVALLSGLIPTFNMLNRMPCGIPTFMVTCEPEYSHVGILVSKVCSSCRQRRLLEEFYFYKDGLGERHSVCKSCMGLAQQQRAADRAVADGRQVLSFRNHSEIYKKDSNGAIVQIVCRTCGTEKTVTEFAFHDVQKTTRCTECRECQAQLSSQRYKEKQVNLKLRCHLLACGYTASGKNARQYMSRHLKSSTAAGHQETYSMHRFLKHDEPWTYLEGQRFEPNLHVWQCDPCAQKSVSVIRTASTTSLTTLHNKMLSHLRDEHGCSAILLSSAHAVGFNVRVLQQHALTIKRHANDDDRREVKRVKGRPRPF
jgi:hypothetical protein